MDAVIYARFSCSKQREESIEDQERVCRDYAASQGWRVAHVYADHAMSATTDARPQFRRMLADAEKGGFGRVIVYKLDRFARNRYDSAVNRSRLKKCGVDLVSATESISDGPEGVLIESLLEGLAEYYSRQLSENVRRGIEGNALKCRANGRKLYGYDIVDGEYVINEGEAAIIRRMYGILADGGTATDVVHDLAGVTTRTGAKWTVSGVCKTLRRPQYKGTYSYAGHVVDGGMEAIVEPETWERAVDRLGSNGTPHTTTGVYLLSGKLEDMDGHKYVGMSGTGRRGKTYYYYWCRETGHRVSRDDLDARVAGAVAVALSDPATVDLVADLVLEGQREADAAQIEIVQALEDELKAAEREYDRLIDTCAKVGVDDRLTAQIQDVRDRIAEAESRLAYERSELPTISRDMVRFWVASIASAPDTDTLLANFVSAVRMRLDGVRTELLVAFTLDQISNKPPAETGGLYRWRMVDSRSPHTNPTTKIWAIPGGFVLAA